MALRIGIVVGEASGDILAEGLIKAIRQIHPDAQFEGIGGARMNASGFKSLYDAERLAVMGFVEPLKRLPELLSIRKHIVQHFIANPPSVFIGVDAPDFNLSVERRLKAHGIKTVHYVSPSVWAWRQYRVKKIAHSVDLMLTLFPFEEAFYKKHHVPVEFVGHALADEIPLQPDTLTARQALGIASWDKIIALLPGSRGGEVALLGQPFLETAKWCLERDPDLFFAVPLASEKTFRIMEAELAKSGLDPARVKLFQGQSRRVMEAADVILLASGTATLEALLLKKPMVVAYKLPAFSYLLAKWLVKLPYYSLANLLVGRRLVSEYIQKEVIPADMGADLLSLLSNRSRANDMRHIYLEVHHSLKQGGSAQAAQAILKLIG